MSVVRKGLWDKTAVPVGWFDETTQSQGWVTSDFLDDLPAGSNPSKFLLSNGQSAAHLPWGPAFGFAALFGMAALFAPAQPQLKAAEYTYGSHSLAIAQASQSAQTFGKNVVHVPPPAGTAILRPIPPVPPQTPEHVAAVLNGVEIWQFQAPPLRPVPPVPPQYPEQAPSELRGVEIWQFQTPPNRPLQAAGQFADQPGATLFEHPPVSVAVQAPPLRPAIAVPAQPNLQQPDAVVFGTQPPDAPPPGDQPQLNPPDYRFGQHAQHHLAASQYAAVFSLGPRLPQGNPIPYLTQISAAGQPNLQQPAPHFKDGRSPAGASQGSAPPNRPTLFVASESDTQQPQPVLFHAPPPNAVAGTPPPLKNTLAIPQEPVIQAPSGVWHGTEFVPPQPSLSAPEYQFGSHELAVRQAGQWAKVWTRAPLFGGGPALTPPPARPPINVAPQAVQYQPCGVLVSYNVHWAELLACTQIMATGQESPEQSNVSIAGVQPPEAGPNTNRISRPLQAAPQGNPEQVPPVIFRQQLTAAAVVDNPPLRATRVTIPTEILDQPPSVYFRPQPPNAPLGDVPPVRPFYGPTEEPGYQPSWFQATNIAAFEFVENRKDGGWEYSPYDQRGKYPELRHDPKPDKQDKQDKRSRRVDPKADPELQRAIASIGRVAELNPDLVTSDIVRQAEDMLCNMPADQLQLLVDNEEDLMAFLIAMLL
jgi:hypothetical protein